MKRAEPGTGPGTGQKVPSSQRKSRGHEPLRKYSRKYEAAGLIRLGDSALDPGTPSEGPMPLLGPEYGKVPTMSGVIIEAFGRCGSGGAGL